MAGVGEVGGKEDGVMKAAEGGISRRNNHSSLRKDGSLLARARRSQTTITIVVGESIMVPLGARYRVPHVGGGVDKHYGKNIAAVSLTTWINALSA
mmetsp:Transcript_13882/g.29752  ORF Transcript_13882/g.29752 Transcript_13882/m.29752 type:complete len:96 (+) Transcript_13882:11-298(+)